MKFRHSSPAFTHDNKSSRRNAFEKIPLYMQSILTRQKFLHETRVILLVFAINYYMAHFLRYYPAKQTTPGRDQIYRYTVIHIYRYSLTRSTPRLPEDLNLGLRLTTPLRSQQISTCIYQKNKSTFRRSLRSMYRLLACRVNNSLKASLS